MICWSIADRPETSGHDGACTEHNHSGHDGEMKEKEQETVASQPAGRHASAPTSDLNPLTRSHLVKPSSFFRERTKP